MLYTCGNPRCRQPFTDKPSRQRQYCSVRCRTLMRRQERRHLLCQNPACENVTEVTQGEHKWRKYCSKKCAAYCNQNIKHAGRKGGLERARRHRLKILASLNDKSKLECFRYGYTLGLQSKTRQLQQRRLKVVDRRIA